MGKATEQIKARKRSRNLVIRRGRNVRHVLRIRPEKRAGKAGNSIVLGAQRWVGVIENQTPRQDHSNRRQNPGKELEKHIIATQQN